MPAPQPGRDALMASIQGAGVHMLKKRSDTSSPAPTRSTPQPVEEPATNGGGGGGGDLTAALAAALMERNKRMGDSDDEDDDDDDWD